MAFPTQKLHENIPPTLILPPALERENSHPALRIDNELDDDDDVGSATSSVHTCERVSAWEAIIGDNQEAGAKSGGRCIESAMPVMKGAPPMLGDTAMGGAKKFSSFSLGHQLKKIGSSRAWAAVVNTLFDQSKAVPGFVDSIGADGVTITSTPAVEEATANKLLITETSDVPRKWDTFTFKVAELEQTFQQYYKVHFGGQKGFTVGRLLFLAQCVIVIAVAPINLGWELVAFPLISMAAILGSTRLTSDDSITMMAVNSAVVLPIFAAEVYIADQGGVTNVAVTELVVALTAACAVFCMQMRPWNVIASVLVPAIIVTWVWIATHSINGHEAAWEIFRIIVLVITVMYLLITASIILERSIRQRYLLMIKARAERSNATALLVRMLPASVVKDIKNSNELKTKVHPKVSIMFVEIHEFDTHLQFAPPALCVSVLNRVFNAFDTVVANTSAYKVESVGAVYMIAANLTEKDHEHVDTLIDIARKLTTIVADRSLPTSTSQSAPIQLRLGIHTGEVIAGVIEKKVFRYRLFGDTVNTASRMCSTCAPGNIHLSSTALAELRDLQSKYINAIKDGERDINIKGKGLMHTAMITMRKLENTTLNTKNISYRNWAGPARNAINQLMPITSPRGKHLPLNESAGGSSSPTPQRRTKRQNSGIWGEERTRMPSVTSPPSATDVIDENKVHTTIRLSRNEPQGSPHTPTLDDTKSMWRSESFYMEDMTVLPQVKNELSAGDLEIPSKIAQDPNASRAVPNRGTLKFKTPEWMEKGYEQATFRASKRHAKRTLVLCNVAAAVVIVAMLSVNTWGNCPGDISLLSLVAAGVGAINTCILFFESRYPMQNITLLRAAICGSMLMCTLTIAGSTVPVDSPYVNICAFEVTPVGGIHSMVVMLAVLACGCGMLFIHCAYTIGFLTTVYICATGHIAQEADWLLCMNALLVIAFLYNKEKTMREDFISKLQVDTERRGYYSVACMLLPEHVVQKMTSTPIEAKDRLKCSKNPLSCAIYSSQDDDVAILFADIVGFTAFCKDTRADIVVDSLRKLFAELDTLATKCNVCKIETIGDAYWAAANLPKQSEDEGDSAIYGIAKFALGIHSVCRKLTIAGTNRHFQMRVGIAYGSVSTGVVGTMSPRYHAFGPVVTSAMAMESQAGKGNVLVTPEFSVRLQQAMKQRRHYTPLKLTKKEDTINSPLHLMSPNELWNTTHHSPNAVIHEGVELNEQMFDNAAGVNPFTREESASTMASLMTTKGDDRSPPEKNRELDWPSKQDSGYNSPVRSSTPVTKDGTKLPTGANSPLRSVKSLPPIHHRSVSNHPALTAEDLPPALPDTEHTDNAHQEEKLEITNVKKLQALPNVLDICLSIAEDVTQEEK